MVEHGTKRNPEPLLGVPGEEDGHVRHEFRHE
jgi:hypothetical protein